MIEGNKIEGEKTEKEYRAIPMLSASDLRQFTTDRKKFYKEKVLGEKREEEYNKSILIGSICHCLLLEPDEFDKRYLLSTCETPPTGMVLTFTESLYRQTMAHMDEDGNVTVDFSEMLQIAHIESGFKISLEAATKKFNETGLDYYKQLVAAKKDGLEICCLDDINIATKIVKMVKEDEFVGKYFTNTDYCELKAEGFLVDGVEMKCMFDKIIPDHEHETIQFIDPKIVFDNQNFYREYFLKKRADIQGYIYYQGLRSGKINLGFDYSNYIILPPIFIAVDSGCHYKPVQYRMSPLSLENAYEGFVENGREYKGVKEIMEELQWSKETGNWFITKKVYENQGIVNL